MSLSYGGTEGSNPPLFVPDSGGSGKFRGGLALVRQYCFLAEEGVLQLRTDRRTHVPYGPARRARRHRSHSVR